MSQVRRPSLLENLMRSGLVALVFSVASPAICSPDNHSSSPSGGVPTAVRVPSLRLDEPDWQPMTGEQINTALRERTLIVDETYRPYPDVRVKIFWMGGCPPREHFGANGIWSRYECQRGPRLYSGRWETERFRGGERLCVAASDFPKLCRFVWLGAKPNNVFMAASRMAWEEPMDDPRTFNPYRLVVPGK